MPKKQKKTKEEKTAENYFPVDRDDLKNTIEKQIKNNTLDKDILRSAVEKKIKPIIAEEIIKGAIEKPYKKQERSTIETVTQIKSKKKRKKSSRKKTSRKTIKKYSPEKITLKKNGYELIITEKPQAALKISSALGKSTKKNANGVPYYEVDRQGKKIVVGCAVGHLMTLSQDKTGTEVPIFDISWKPNFLVRKKDFTKKYYDTLLRLAKQAGEITVATDYDIEGEVIGLNVIRFICNQKDANRMKFSTLTPKELNNAYEKKSSIINWGQAIAGETRHYLDWFYGINLSRALMNAIKTTGRFKIMSIGRVQGPSLNLIVQKEREIQAFKSTPYWQIFITVEQDKKQVELKYTKDITKKQELKKFENLKNKKIQVETKKSQQKIPPNPPFNLSTLQTEAYKLHGITPARTLQLAQSLYLNGLISYPRTSSQKLPPEIGYKEILDKLAKMYKVQDKIKREKPIEGKKTDPAHPSIYPTGQTEAAINKDEEKIYNLIVKRFLSLFAEDAIIDNKTIKAEIDNLKFSARGSAIVNKGWIDIYPAKINEKEIPDLNGEAEIIDIKEEQKMTQPPKRYSPASIVSELEKRNLGTKATRASIIETLYDRDYVREKSIEATTLGMSLISTLEKHSPIIIDEALTRHFEKEMETIQNLKKGQIQKQEKLIEEAKETITKISQQFKKQEKQIGKELINANQELIEIQKQENTLNQCPECKKGNLAIKYSKKTRRYFVACDKYPDCTKTYSLPPNGIIKKTEKVCDKCGFPILVRMSKGKRPWEFCFNPECETNKQRIEEYNKNKKNN